MALIENIANYRRRRRSFAALNAMSNWQLEDVGLCRADLEKMYRYAARRSSQPTDA